MAKNKMTCCDGKFPTFATILLVLGILWLLEDLKVISADIPWFPVVLIIVALGWMFNSYSKKK